MPASPPSPLIRIPDWPTALAAEIVAVRDQPYALGTHDCLRFSCRCIEAMTGVDYWPRFAGYKNKREALRTIARIAPTLAQAVTRILGQEPTSATFARRGDVVVYRDAGGEHLGICAGATVAVLGEAALSFIRLDHPGVGECWRVG